MRLEGSSTVKYGRTDITYGIRRSTRRKTVSVAIDPEDGVLLTAPAGVSVERLDGVVKAKARWIIGKLRAAEARPTPREFVSGETYLYLGRQYRLRVLPRVRPGAAKLHGAWLEVPVQRALKGTHRAQAVREALVAWYRDRAAERLPERVEAWTQAAGDRAVGNVLITDQRKRWASCDARRNLRFNWRVIQAPMRLVDYVVAHELMHLQHRDHSARFWASLEHVMPDYAERRKALLKLGRSTEL